MEFQFQVAERSGTNNRHLALLRWSMVAIFVWFGIQKFTPYAADAIAPLISNSPFMAWLTTFGKVGEARIIGTIELITAALLVIGSVNAIASALGSALASGTFVMTVSFVFTTPGITLTSHSGFPIVSTLVEQFLIKDVALLASCLTLLVASVRPIDRSALRSDLVKAP
jgi:reactive chlorine resistance protein C